MDFKKNIVVDGDTMIDKRTGVASDPEDDSTYWKDKFQVDFIVFMDHKNYMPQGGGDSYLKWH